MFGAYSNLGFSWYAPEEGNKNKSPGYPGPMVTDYSENVRSAITIPVCASRLP